MFTKMTVQNSTNLMFGVELLKVVSETPAGNLFLIEGYFHVKERVILRQRLPGLAK